MSLTSVIPSTRCTRETRRALDSIASRRGVNISTIVREIAAKAIEQTNAVSHPDGKTDHLDKGWRGAD